MFHIDVWGHWSGKLGHLFLCCLLTNTDLSNVSNERRDISFCLAMEVGIEKGWGGGKREQLLMLVDYQWVKIMIISHVPQG